MLHPPAVLGRRFYLFALLCLLLAWGLLACVLADCAWPAIGCILALSACFYALWRHVMQRVLAQQRCAELQGQLIDLSSEAMLLADETGCILAVNPAFERITGYAAREVQGETTAFLLSGRQGGGFHADVYRTVREQGAWSGEVWNRSKQGEVYLQQLTIRQVDLPGMPRRHVAVFSDISLQKAQEARIEYLAHHDALTGLPNRAALAGFLQQAMQRARMSGRRCAVMLLDLDNFKTVNDSLGHDAGDQLLCELARRLQRLAGDADRLARQGGDAFVLIIDQAEAHDDLVYRVEDLLHVVSEGFTLDGHELHASMSVGISVFPEDGDSAETLLRNADAAMHQAKAGGRSTYRFFDPSMSVAASRRLVLESELWQALAGNQLLLHYQPQVDLLAGGVVGVEPLVRWRHPQRGMISPAEFIPVAEETGLIIPLGHWVLLTACRQARAWMDAGIEMGEMAVNISAVQFRQPDFVQSVRRVLADTGLPADRLELEITETAVMHSADSSVTTLSELKAMGVKLAIDDFGTGYSSLAYLRRFPIDRLKIDRTFVADLESDPEAASLVASIVALGRSLGLRLVAEGVENAAQAAFLREIACERVQGFHFCRPGAAEHIALASPELATSS